LERRRPRAHRRASSTVAHHGVEFGRRRSGNS
jgi:hypothetical protein